MNSYFETKKDYQEIFKKINNVCLGKEDISILEEILIFQDLSIEPTIDNDEYKYDPAALYQAVTNSFVYFDKMQAKIDSLCFFTTMQESLDGLFLKEKTKDELLVRCWLIFQEAVEDNISPCEAYFLREILEKIF